KALKINYDPVVDIRPIKPNKKGDTDIQAAVKETSKYSVKSADFLSEKQDRRSEEHTSELQSRFDLVCRLLLEKKNSQGSPAGVADVPHGTTQLRHRKC